MNRYRGLRSLIIESIEPKRMLAASPATVRPLGDVPASYVDLSALHQALAEAWTGSQTTGSAVEAGTQDAPTGPGVARAEPAPEWTELGPMVHPRGEHANAVVNGKIYAFGGLDTHRDGPDEVERFDPGTQTWEVVSSMPLPRHHFTVGASVYRNEIWIAGGKTDDDTSGVRRVDVFNTATNRWRRGPNLPTEHWGGPSVILNHKLHVLTGGINIDDTAQHHWVLDLQNQGAGWKRAADVPFARVHAGGVALNGKIYVVGGERNHTHRAGDTKKPSSVRPGNRHMASSGAPAPGPVAHRMVDVQP